MKQPHILIPIHDFNAGGTEVIAFRLAQAWMKAGCRVTILAGATDGPMRSRTPDGANIVILSPERGRSPTSRLFLGKPMAEAAKPLAPDVLFIPGNFHFVLARAFKKAMPHVPVVAKISNPLGDGPSWLVRPALRWWTKGIDLFAAMSPGLQADLQALLPGRACATIHDPFIDDDQPVLPRAVREPDHGPLRLLIVGRLEPQKNVRLAVDTLAAVRQHSDATLTIVGDGSERAAVEAHVARNGLGAHVTLTGHVSDVSAAFGNADVLLVTSRYEGGPAVVIEALARSVPFVSTDCSHLLRALVTDKPALGMLAKAPTADGLAKAVLVVSARPPAPETDIAPVLDRHRLGHAARQYLDHFAALLP
jgi:glycosyltransferase involved in cell wall biosynthesis